MQYMYKNNNNTIGIVINFGNRVFVDKYTLCENVIDSRRCIYIYFLTAY